MQHVVDRTILALPGFGKGKETITALTIGCSIMELNGPSVSALACQVPSHRRTDAPFRC